MGERRSDSLLDTVTVATPEGVELQITLAGIGSRMIAALVDAVIQTVVVLAIGLIVGDNGSSIAVAVGTVAVFLVVFGYHILFETLASGRTPGKRWNGLRVVRAGGRPVGFLTSAVRNILRIVDFLPALYALGMITMLVSRRNQRLGDLAAGTLVVREKHGGRQRRNQPVIPTWKSTVARTGSVDNWDVTAVTAEDLATVRRFLERREQLSFSARAQLAETLGSRLWPKVAGAPEGLSREAFLEGLVVAKARRT